MKQAPELALMDMFEMMRKDMETQLEVEKNELISKFQNELSFFAKEALSRTLDQVVKEVQRIPYVKGDRGEDGWTPSKGDIDTWMETVFKKVMAAVKKPENGINGKDGYTPIAGLGYPTEKEIKEIILKHISQIKIPNPDLNKIANTVKLEVTGEEIVEKVNRLATTPDKQIDASHIKNLPRMVNKQVKSSMRGGGDSVQVSDLTTQTDGTTKTFTIPVHSKAIALLGTQFPVIYRPTTDWSSSGTTLTLTSEVGAPQAGQTLLFLYVPG